MRVRCECICVRLRVGTCVCVGVVQIYIKRDGYFPTDRPEIDPPSRIYDHVLVRRDRVEDGDDRLAAAPLRLLFQHNIPYILPIGIWAQAIATEAQDLFTHFIISGFVCFWQIENTGKKLKSRGPDRTFIRPIVDLAAAPSRLAVDIDQWRSWRGSAKGHLSLSQVL